MSSFVKSSPPYSSSYGAYGAANINPYASYFGPQQQQLPITSPTSQSASNPFPYGSTFSGTGTGQFLNQQQSANMVSSPLSSSMYNPHSFSATSPFTSPGQLPGGGGNQFFIPQPTQTRIIGGINNSSIGGGSFNQQALPRYTLNSVNSYGHQSSSPVRSNEMTSEPMHYSPIHTSSPYPTGTAHSIGVHNNSPTGTIILPSYLLGLDQPYHGSGSSFHQSGGSPPSGIINTPGSTGSKNPVGPSSFITSSSRGYRRTVLFEPSAHPDSENVGSDGEAQGTSKPKGPPKHGFGSVEGSSTKSFLDSPLMKDTYCIEADCTVSSGNSPTTSDHTSLTPRGVGSQSTNNWVTVFGFPAGASSFIVTNFSTLGKIMEVKCTPGSNWLHLRFSNAIETRRALNKNGKVLGRSIMVGVILSDSTVIKQAEQTDIYDDVNAASPASSQHNSSSILKERNLDSSQSIKSRIRPLATGSLLSQQTRISNTPNVAYSPRSLSQMPSIARESLEVERNPDGSSSLPTASNGMFTKALEFMFGW